MSRPFPSTIADIDPSFAPWPADKRWSTGRMKDGSKAALIVLGIFAGFWNAMGWTAFIVCLNDRTIGKGIYAVALFPAVGLLLIFAFLYSLSQRLKFGASELEMETLPGAVGGYFAGTIHVPVMLNAPEGVHVIIRCIHRTVSGSGKNKSTHEKILYEEQQTLSQLPRDSSSSGASGCAIPVSFALPANALPTGGEYRNCIVWRLSASAAMEGTDYSSSFEIPVFVVPSNGVPRTEAIAAKLRKPPAPIAQRAAESGIRFSRDTAGRLRFEFPAARNKGMAIFTTVFGLGFAIGGYLFYVFDGSMLFTILFGGVGILILVGAAFQWFKSRSVAVHQAGVEIDWRMLGLSGMRTIERGQITAVSYKSNAQFGDTQYFQLLLVVNDAPNPVVVAGGLLQPDAKWIAEEFSKALGVEVSADAFAPTNISS